MCRFRNPEIYTLYYLTGNCCAIFRKTKAKVKKENQERGNSHEKKNVGGAVRNGAVLYGGDSTNRRKGGRTRGIHGGDNVLCQYASRTGCE